MFIWVVVVELGMEVNFRFLVNGSISYVGLGGGFFLYLFFLKFLMSCRELYILE